MQIVSLLWVAPHPCLQSVHFSLLWNKRLFPDIKDERKVGKSFSVSQPYTPIALCMSWINIHPCPCVLSFRAFFVVCRFFFCSFLRHTMVWVNIYKLLFFLVVLFHMNCGVLLKARMQKNKFIFCEKLKADKMRSWNRYLCDYNSEFYVV